MRLGCSAIGFTIYPGSDDVFAMMEQIREMSDHAKSVGIATVICLRMPLPSMNSTLSATQVF